MKNSVNERPEKNRGRASRPMMPWENIKIYPASLWDQEKASGMLALLSQPAVENDGEQLLPFEGRVPYNQKGAAADEQKRKEE